MEHDDIREREIIERYLLGKLSPVETDEFEEHLIFCDHCMAEVSQMQQIIGAVRARSAEEITTEINAPVVQTEKRKKVVYLYTALAVAAVIAIVAFIFVPQYFHKETENKSFRDFSGIEIDRIDRHANDRDGGINSPDHIASTPDSINRNQRVTSPEFAVNPVLDSSINAGIAYAEIRSVQNLPVLMDPMPVDGTRFKTGETISFKWGSYYVGLNYRLSIYNNKGMEVFATDIKSIQKNVEYKYHLTSLTPGLYYWRVIPPKNKEYPHTGKYLIMK